MTASWIDSPFLPAQLPRLTEALDGLVKLLADGEAPVKTLLGAASGARWLQQLGSVAQMLEKGWVTQPALDAALRLLPPEAQQLRDAELLDVWLLPALLQSVAGLAPLATQLPPRWRDVQAAGFAVDAWRPLLDPAANEAPPAVGIPQCLPLLGAYRAALGHEGLSPMVAFATGRGPQPPFVQRWLDDPLAALHTPAVLDDDADSFAEHEAAWLEDLLLGLHARTRKQGGWPVLVATAPDGGVTWDTTRRTLGPTGKPSSLLQSTAQGWLYPLPGALPAPPATSVRLLAAGWRQLHIEVSEPEALDDVLDGLFELCEDPQPPFVMEGEGFVVTPN